MNRIIIFFALLIFSLGSCKNKDTAQATDEDTDRLLIENYVRGKMRLPEDQEIIIESMTPLGAISSQEKIDSIKQTLDSLALEKRAFFLDVLTNKQRELEDLYAQLEKTTSDKQREELENQIRRENHIVNLSERFIDIEAKRNYEAYGEVAVDLKPLVEELKKLQANTVDGVIAHRVKCEYLVGPDRRKYEKVFRIAADKSRVLLAE